MPVVLHLWRELVNPHPRGHVNCSGPLQAAILLRLHGNSTPVIAKGRWFTEVLGLASLSWHSRNIKC